MLAELGRIITDDKVSKTKGNLEGGIKALLGLKGPELEGTITNKMVVEAVNMIEKRTKKKGSGKLVNFHDVSPINISYIIFSYVWLCMAYKTNWNPTSRNMRNPFPADNFSKNKTKVIPNKEKLILCTRYSE